MIQLDPTILHAARAAAAHELMSLVNSSAAALKNQHAQPERTYLRALHATASEAHRLLSAFGGSRELTHRIFRADAVNGPADDAPADPTQAAAHLGLLDRHRQRISDALSAGGAVKDAKFVTALTNSAVALLAMFFERAFRGEQTATLAREKRCELIAHLELMRESYRTAERTPGTSAQKLERAFHTALSMKYALTGRLPRLIFVHDLDNSLLPNEDYYRAFPNWELFLKAKAMHDTYRISPWQARFAVLSLFGPAHEESRASYDVLLRLLGERVYQSMFADARDFFHHSSTLPCGEAAVQSALVTAGNRTIAVELARRLAIPAAMVFGVDERSCAGFDKPWGLLNFSLSAPENIVVCIDDNDASLMRGLAAPSILEEDQPAAPLRDLCFFAARTPAAGEPDSFGLYKALRSAGVLYLENCRAQGSAGRSNGYQGALRYASWRQDWLTRQSFPAPPNNARLSPPQFNI